MDCSPDGRGFLFYPMYHLFDVDVAKQYGVDEAIMIANFQFWISHNATNKKNLHDGRFWTYNSYKAFQLLFPYYSEKQIRRIVGSLVTTGILITGNYNAHTYDNTNWYAFQDEAKWLSNLPSAHLGMGASAQMGRPNDTKRAGRSAHSGQPIPDTNSVINTDNISPPNGGDAGQVNFIIVGQPGSDPEEKKKSPAKKEKKEIATEHWQHLVKIWFDFYESKKQEKPSFEPVDQENLRKIITKLKKKAKEKSWEWTEAGACQSLSKFLEFSYKVEWLSQNYLIKNINSQFDKIIADARGTNQSTTQQKGQQPVSASSAFSKFSALNNEPKQ